MGKTGFPTPSPAWARLRNDPPAGCMVYEKLIRYTGLAVGLKPSAMECEARLRGLYRIIYSKTIKPARGCSSAADANDGQRI